MAPLMMPVIVWQVAKGGTYLTGNLFEDYLIRDNMVRLFYSDPRTTISGLGFPAGTKILSFFDSDEGRGLTRTTLHTKYGSLKEVAAGIARYKSQLEQEPEGVTGPIWSTLRDTSDAKKVFDRVTDRAKADWFESERKEKDTYLRMAERQSRYALDAVQGQAQALQSLTKKEYEGAQGFVVAVRRQPETPKAGDDVTLSPEPPSPAR